ncbi:MAG: proline dehydrogenase [Flavobacteriaceae bacterium]|nr:proline dehydrogenase [Flavobacteriaceae bacterium]
MDKTLFDNTEIAFQLKSDSELDRAYFLFKMIANEPLVRIGTAMTKFAINLHLPVDGLIRATVFDHFCGGVNEKDCLTTVDALSEANVYSVLDYSVEGKESDAQFDATKEKIIELTRFAKNKKAMPFSVFKPTGLGRFELWRKKSENEPLSEQEKAEWTRIEARYDAVCKTAYECDISLLIDAEESWMQDAADALCQEMMKRYNKTKPIVFNTLQCYRHDRYSYLREQHDAAKKGGYTLGFKIVRGAYMEKEHARALEHGYPTPICESKKATDDLFNEVLHYCIANVEDISVFIGTHNEASNYLAVEEIKQKDLAKDEPRIWFGQLYGMSDHITYNLAAAGFNVAKYIPFGPVKDVMPYLIRRAEENTSVAGQTSRELNLLKKERQRRGM